MPATAAVIAAFAVFFAAVGVPLALLTRERREGWAALVADAAGFGIVLVTLGVTALAWLGWAGAAVCGLGWFALIAVCILRRSALPARRTSMPRRPGYAVAVAIVLLAAASLRLHNVNFTPWVGDMGAYVTWANEFARTGVLSASWPPVFPVFLSLSSAVFGAANTTAIVGVAGILLVVAIGRLLWRLRVNRWVVLAVMLLVALQQQAVWFSNFPASEALDTPLFVIWMTLMYQGLTVSRRRLPAVLGAQVLLTVALSLLRGSGVLLILPLLVVAVIVLSARALRPWTARIVLALATTALGAGIGYWYGITEIPQYFVSAQIDDVVPGSIVHIMGTLGFFSSTPLVFVVILVPGIVLGVIGVRLLRAPADLAAASPRLRVLGIVFGGILALGVTAGFVVDSMVSAILLRMGIWLVAGTVLALMLVVGRRLPRPRQIAIITLSTTAAMFIGLHTLRLGYNRGHAFYLYWDRYLVSEVLPSVVVVSAIAAGALVPLLVRRRLAIPAAVVAAGLAIVPSIAPLSLQVRDTYMAGAYTFTRQLQALDTTDAPAVWSATSPKQLAGWFFPNTWMAFAVPLKRSFGMDVLNANQNQNNFAPDEVLTSASLVHYLGCSSTRSVIVYETQAGGRDLASRLRGSTITLRYIGERTSAISLLSQPPGSGWTHEHIPVKAWLASSAEPVPSATC